MVYFALAALIRGSFAEAIGPVALALVVLLFTYLLSSDLADQVVDLGDHLVVKRGLHTVHVPLSSIIEVSQSVAVNPPAITLRLAKPSKLGRLISFSPAGQGRLNLVGEHSLVTELRERSLAARAQNAG